MSIKKGLLVRRAQIELASTEQDILQAVVRYASPTYNSSLSMEGVAIMHRILSIERQISVTCMKPFVPQHPPANGRRVNVMLLPPRLHLFSFFRFEYSSYNPNFLYTKFRSRNLEFICGYPVKLSSTYSTELVQHHQATLSPRISVSPASRNFYVRSCEKNLLPYMSGMRGWSSSVSR